MTLPKIIKIAVFDDSRKVGFGFWLFVTATFLLMQKLITSDNWMFCAMAAGGLFGIGTVADRYLDKMPNANASKP